MLFDVPTNHHLKVALVLKELVQIKTLMLDLKVYQFTRREAVGTVCCSSPIFSIFCTNVFLSKIVPHLLFSGTNVLHTLQKVLAGLLHNAWIN